MGCKFVYPLSGSSLSVRQVGYEETEREQSLWNRALDSFEGGWFGRGGLKFVSLSLGSEDSEFTRYYAREQRDFILQFNESFFHYQQNIDALEERLAAEFGTIMDLQTGDISGRIYEPLIAADRSINMERLKYLMGLEPGALSDGDYQDLIKIYDTISVVNGAEQVEAFINCTYKPHFEKVNGDQYHVTYTMSPVLEELGKRYRNYVTQCQKVEGGAVPMDVRDLRASIL